MKSETFSSLNIEVINLAWNRIKGVRLLAPQTGQLHNALIHVHDPLDMLHYPYSVPLYRVQTQRIVTGYKQRLAQREV